MNGILRRIADSEFGVFGILDLFGAGGLHAGRFRTVEDDWLDNAPHLSCIPPGSYLCKRIHSPKFKRDVFLVTGVPGRDAIEMHPANTENDVEGCIGVANRFGALNYPDEDLPGHPQRLGWAAVESLVGFERFMTALDGVDDFWLDVEWSAPGAWRRPT